MDEFRLKVFIAAARTLSFTRAAQQMRISQPAVSKHVAELEALYRVRLFERRGSRIALTEAGETLLHHALPIVQAYAALDYQMGLRTDALKGELRIGASTTIAQYLLPAVLARFKARYPEVRLSLESGNTLRIEQALGEGTIDLGLVEGTGRRQGMRYEHFMRDELVLVTGGASPLARCEQIDPADLRSVPLVLREEGSGTLEVIEGALAECGIRMRDLKVVMRLGSTEAIKSFLRESDAAAILSVVAVRDEVAGGLLRITDIAGLEIGRSLSFVRQQGEGSELVQRFVDFARRMR